VLLLLVALIFRGVAFEFRFKATRTRALWGFAFCAGSILAAFAQGLMLGAIVQGIPLDPARHAGGTFAWLSPFALMTGVALVAGYALLGATWLVMKADGDLQALAFRLTRPLVFAVIGFMLLVSLWLPFLGGDVMQRWFTWPNLLYLSPVPVLTALVALLLLRAVARRREVQPFALAIGFFALGFIGLVIGLWPHIVPPDLGIREAAAPPSSQAFLLVGAAFLIPAVLGYTVYSYRVFRGKVQAGSGYH
jgi:cytochrome d ubiquinol oxidase subunit II